MTKRRSYSLSRTLAQFDKLYRSATLIGYIGTKPVTEDFDQFVSDVQKLLPKGIPTSAVRSSLLYMAGREITDEFLEGLAWRLSGNIHRLKEAKPVLPWSCQRSKEWMPCQITRFSAGTNRHGTAGGFFRARVLAGSAAGLLVDFFWSRKFISYLSRKVFSFSKSGGDRVFRHPAEFVGMRFSGLFDDDIKYDKPKFKALAATTGLATWNKSLILKRQRTRASKFSCPFSYSHPCWRCPKGQVACPVACHKLTYVKQHCPACGDFAMFDPESRLKVCVNCAQGGKKFESTRRESTTDDARIQAGDTTASNDAQQRNSGAKVPPPVGGGV